MINKPLQKRTLLEVVKSNIFLQSIIFFFNNDENYVLKVISHKKQQMNLSFWNDFQLSSNEIKLIFPEKKKTALKVQRKLLYTSHLAIDRRSVRTFEWATCWAWYPAQSSGRRNLKHTPALVPFPLPSPSARPGVKVKFFTSIEQTRAKRLQLLLLVYHIPIIFMVVWKVVGQRASVNQLRWGWWVARRGW